MESFAGAYDFAFRRYVVNRSEALLRAAYELGRQAVEQELAVLDLAAAHHSAVRSLLLRDHAPRNIDCVVSAAEEFFVETLGAFEMVQRGFREAAEAAVLGTRQAAIVRRLSGVLADVSLAVDGSRSLREVLQLVAEQARELTGADVCLLTVTPADEHEGKLEGFARAETVRQSDSRTDWGSLRLVDSGKDADGSASVEGGEQVLEGGLTSLDGRTLGRIRVVRTAGSAPFGDVERAVLVHLAQMVSAAVERTRLHQREGGPGSLAGT